MIAQWIPVLWNNWDWDYNFLLDIIEFKLRRMSKHIADHDILMNSKKYARQMQICADLIDRIRQDKYIEEEEKQHEEKWGELIVDSSPCEGRPGIHKMDFYRPKAREQGKEEQERQETHEMYKLAEKRRNKDLDVLFRIMRKRIEHWWD